MKLAAHQYNFYSLTANVPGLLTDGRMRPRGREVATLISALKKSATYDLRAEI